MAPDSSTSSATYTAWTGPTISWGSTCNSTSSDYTHDLKPRSIAAMCRGFRHWLTDTEKAIMRALNLEPTTKGIESCVEKHSTLCRVVKSLPHFRSRLDRRIPCWRSTRWKSLT